MCDNADIVALQETWLLPHDLSYLNDIHGDFVAVGVSAVDTAVGVLRGRPYGGVALLWRKSAFSVVEVINCNSVRVAAIKCVSQSRSILVFTVYMPTDCQDNLSEFTACLSEMTAVIDDCNVDTVFIMGDFNAHPKELFFSEMMNFCREQSWSCADVDLLSGLNTYTYLSEAHGTVRWLDHCLVSSMAFQTIESVKVLYEVSWSDHFPLEIICNLESLPRKTVVNKVVDNKILWGIRDDEQICKYRELCNEALRNIDFPVELRDCCDHICDNLDHRNIINAMYANIKSILSYASEKTRSVSKRNKRKYIVGWNKHVSESHRMARLWFSNWVLTGKPRAGPHYLNMCESRKVFKKKLKWCQDNAEQIKMDILAAKHKAKDFCGFWKKTGHLNPGPSIPVSVDGVVGDQNIANVFKDLFTVEPMPCKSDNLCKPDVRPGDKYTRIMPIDVKNVIIKMERGKSPGLDGISIEHLRYAGVHLPRVLSLLYNFCVGHSFIPEDMLKTVVVPIVKNKTGDPSDKHNYRPISLATTVAKVLDSLLNAQLSKHLQIHDLQFGFRPNLSTEMAIMCLKQTVRYYTDRNTPVYACFLDLSRAFDLVNYDVLWHKLLEETTVPRETVSLLQYWYSNQKNAVRWVSSLSHEYPLKCGVRQGGLTSPSLFNLFVNQLIGRLSGAKVGCSIDGTMINNISYADDMVLLSPSVSALRRLLGICEEYASSHGLKYNASKSVLMVFKAGNKAPSNVPPIRVGGSSLVRVTEAKYLGHMLTDRLQDDADLERERRALAVRCNMLARRFARCTTDVKLLLFRAFCQSFYTCSLWINFTRRAYNALRVQYNDALRAVLKKPRYCSASEMFAGASIDDFFSIIRKRTASMMSRVRGSTNTVLRTLACKINGPFTVYWASVHLLSNRK